jgi:biotin carboxyl carrier protein
MIFDATVEGRTIRVEVRGKNGRYTVSLDGRSLEVDLHEAGRDFMSLLIDAQSYDVALEPRGTGYTVLLDDDALHVDLASAARGSGAAPKSTASGPARLTAPMPGKVVRILVEPGGEVAAGQGLVVMEAMKMENELRSPRGGRVKEILVREGQAVEAGALLALVE